MGTPTDEVTTSTERDVLVVDLFIHAHKSSQHTSTHTHIAGRAGNARGSEQAHLLR